MKFLDLNKENKVIKSSLFKRVKKRGEYLLGSYCEELESIFPQSVGFKYGVAVKNATDALTILIRMLIKEYPKVVCPNFTAYPVAIAARTVTKKVYYVDVDSSLTIDVNKLPDIKKSIVIAVNLFGNNANLEALRMYCHNTGSILIEDCAQSTGSEVLPRLSDFAVYSFYPTKPLGSMGDGGMICFNEDYEKYFKLMRFYGQTKDDIKHIGINSRMDEWQCAIVLEKMKHYRKWNAKRIEIAERYNKHAGIKAISNNVYHRYPVLFHNREKAIKKITFPYLIQYKKHITDMPKTKGLNNKVNFRVNDKILILPCHSQMRESEICEVEEFLCHASKG